MHDRPGRKSIAAKLAAAAARDPRAWLAGGYAVLWVGGIVTYSVKGSPPADVPWAGPAFLALAAVLVVSTTRPRHLAAPLVAAVIGFASEVVGVATGAVYSAYTYSTVLGPKFWDVPLAMLAAWLVLAAYVLERSHRWRLPPAAAVPAAATWMTAIDLVIDPLAANALGFWKWRSTGAYYGIPAHNFAGWFAVSLLIFGLVWKLPYGNPWARWVGVSMIGFFTVVAFSFGLVIPGCVGVALIALDVSMPSISVRPTGVRD